MGGRGQEQERIVLTLMESTSVRRDGKIEGTRSMEGQALIVPEGEGVDIISPSTCTSTTPNNRAPISARETYPPPLPIEMRNEEPNESAIVLRLPRIYQKRVTGKDRGGGERWQPPSLEWLEGAWSVTHSTLGMWRKAKNVRISYKIIPKGNGEEALLDDLVASVPTEKVHIYPLSLLPLLLVGCVKNEIR